MERVVAAWRWWLDGLVELVLAIAARLRRRRVLGLVPVGDGWVVERADGRRMRTVLRLADGPAPRLLPDRLARRFAGRDVDLTIDPERVVNARIGPLGIEGRSYVAEIVAHRLERLTPWPAADVLHLATEETPADDAGRFSVRIVATSRALAEPLVAALAAIPVRDHRFVLAADLPALADPVEVRRARQAIAGRLRFWTAAGAVIAVLALLFLWDRAAGLGDDLDELRSQVAEYRSRLVAPPPGSDVARIAELARRRPIVVLSLEKLSRALPDDTHLTELGLEDGHWILKGISRDLAGLSTVLEASPDFRAPVFRQATTREADGDHFTFDLSEQTVTEEAR